eukprot:gnl/TRDRNA2_/TRDRNA2_185115_c0_seq1.p1 gnl/TRDRNA2_/TRDRNA2_185115_c0~~gnl/TRDRNA2_/TRDRNA2_185115_c0_seq1.p1  ORF type:complete len:228 (-),score=67.37 gnl/TRDRNA2_/TRDRNA2_185115_c0_seq1:68-751(-)
MADAEHADLTDRIMEHQRREFVLLSRAAQRGRELRKLRQSANEAVCSFEDTQKDSLKGACVDAAVNIDIAILRQCLKQKDQEIQRLTLESQNATFHPNSIQGQKLLQKCTHLIEENGELGRQLGEDWLQKLRIQISLEREKRLQLRQRIRELDSHAEQVDKENERMQLKIAELGNKYKETKTEVDTARKEIEEYRSGVKRPRDPEKKAKADKAEDKTGGKRSKKDKM